MTRHGGCQFVAAARGLRSPRAESPPMLMPGIALYSFSKFLARILRPTQAGSGQASSRLEVDSGLNHQPGPGPAPRLGTAHYSNPCITRVPSCQQFYEGY